MRVNRKVSEKILGALRGVLLGSMVGVALGTVFVASGCGSGSVSVPWRQVDRAGKPGLEMVFLENPAVINAFNRLSPSGDKFNLDTGAGVSVTAEYRRVLRALAALTCFVAAQTGNTSLKPLGRTCPAIDLSSGAAPAAFTTWLEETGDLDVEQGVYKRFEGTFLPNVLRLDTDVTFANRDVLRYAHDTLGASPLICKPDNVRTYCGGRRFGEDAIRFTYSQIFLGTVGALTPGLATVEDDGLGPEPIDAAFPYIRAPGP
jgi:hypothetical protein